MKSSDLDLDVKSIDSVLNKILEKSAFIKSKNVADIKQLNDDFNVFLETGRRLVQFCVNDKVSLINELETLQSHCNQLKEIFSLSKTCTKCPKKYKPHLQIEKLFDSDDDDEDEKKETAAKAQQKQHEEVFIPDTCQQDDYLADMEIDAHRDGGLTTIQETPVVNLLDYNPVRNLKLDRLKLNEQSTPKSVKKLLNDHGLEDLTCSPTVLESDNHQPLVGAATTSASKKQDKYDNLMDKLFNMDSSAEKSTLAPASAQTATTTATNVQANDSLNYSLDFNKKPVTPPPKNKLKKLKSSEKLLASPENTNKKKLKQITMTQAFDNIKSQSSKENVAAGASSIFKTAKNDAKSSNKLTSIENKYKQESDSDLFVVEPKYHRLTSTSSQQQSENDIESLKSGDEDEDDLIFNFDRPPKKKTNSPNYKHVQVVKKQNERKKLTASSCRECETYWKSLPDDQRATRMQDICRHRNKYEAPPTPEDYWSIRFPNTQECIQKGYGGVLVEPDVEGPKRARRKRPLKLIERNKDDDEDI